ncbi:unnamed protein product [Linum tenue]|uniref:Uncharacterized protein n=1 Tax=Linum tenue TaxID=586396 RepID=A0AAV0HJE2_9ROSI|nr:unnamed protein product [Linum tenue]
MGKVGAICISPEGPFGDTSYGSSAFCFGPKYVTLRLSLSFAYH